MRARSWKHRNAPLLLETLEDLERKAPPRLANLSNLGQSEGVGEKACHRIFQMLVF